MGRMKYVMELIHDDEYYNLQKAIKTAEHQETNQFIFRTEILDITTAKAMLTIMKKHINQGV